MFNPGIIIAAILSCMALLIISAVFTEWKFAKGKDLTNNGVVYALSLGTFYSAWTYYGSVGLAARSGFLFFTFYLGATLAAVFWWSYLRKLVCIKKEFRLTSIADFIAARYGKSQFIAAMITITIIVGIAPYIALQLKAIRTTYGIIATPLASAPIIGNDVTPFVVIFMILFTILFGVRHMDPTKRHAGMVMSVAVESLIQMVFFLIAGIFVVYYVFNGFGDIFQQLEKSTLDIKMPLRETASPFLTWVTFVVLAMSAVVFLPRQFHISVVELSNEKNIRPAIWLFPLYTFLTALFMFPIAMGGLLKGLPLERADSFVLAIPAKFGSPWISLLIFIGGFAAATSMIMISSMTLATMMTNHLILPALGGVKRLRFLQRHILLIKRTSVASVIILGYVSDRMLGETYALVSIGIMSFAVAAQFAPAILGGIFWRRANKTGAVLGLSSGILIWFYTILMPAFAKSGWVPITLLENGPWGIAFLKPEQLFGVTDMHPITHGTMWSLFINISLYALGSVFTAQNDKEKHLADSFVDILIPRNKLRSALSTGSKTIDLKEKIGVFKKRLNRYFNKPQISEIVEAGIEKARIDGQQKISVIDLSMVVNEIQKYVGGAIGAAAANKAFKDELIYTAEELKALRDAYTEVLIELRVSPEELREKIDYYQERDILLSHHAEELQEKVRDLKREIAERQRVENALKRNRKRLQIILESNPDPIVVYDNKGRALYINPAFTRIFGWHFNEIKGKPIPYFLEKKEVTVRQRLKELSKSNTPISYESKRLTKDGRALDVLVSVAKIGGGNDNAEQIIVNIKETTQKKQMEAQLQQTQKMEALGTLAGGIAHDFNNILAAIHGFTELSIDLTDEGTLLRDNLNDVLIAAKRAKELVRQILAFSRQTNDKQKPMQVKIILKEVLKLIRSSLPATINIRHHIDSDSLICGDAIQINQVLMNLLTNSGYAMQDKGGTLAVNLSDVALGEKDAEMIEGLSPGDYIKLTVEDTGSGIPPHILDRIFEPFFTTKPEGEGTGMGLSVVHGIVKSHGGSISVRSEPEKGTMFTVLLPIIRKASAPIKESETAILNGSEKILFIDDEQMIASWGKQLMEGMGYEVTTRTSSLEALELFKTKPNRFDLVITDLTMPKLSGEKLAEELKIIRPDIPIILCTGFGANIDKQKRKSMGVQGFLMKPILKSEMSRQIRMALEPRQQTECHLDGSGVESIPQE